MPSLDFLGSGPIRPFRRDQHDWTSASGIELLKSNVGQILGTRCDSTASAGELPWRTEFGSKLHLLRHRKDSPVVRALARAWAQEALRLWEPRLFVKNAVLLPTTNERARIVAVSFGLRGSRGQPIIPMQSVDVTLLA